MSDYRHLGEHLSEPAVQDAVLAYITQLDAPFLIGEVWRPLQLPRTAVNRVLSRLLNKGVVTREAVMAERPCPNPRAGKHATMMAPQFMYRLVEDGE